jgi:hypothetical protein
MGKMKQLKMRIDEEREQNQDFDAIMEEAHYYGLVSNVSQWIVDNKSTRILTDIEHAVHKLYLNGNYSKKGNTK